MKYSKTQTGWFFIVIFAFILIGMVISYSLEIEDGKDPFNQLLFLILFLGFCILNFYQLRIVVNQDCFYIIYGIGLIRIKILPESLQYVKAVLSPGMPDGEYDLCIVEF